METWQKRVIALEETVGDLADEQQTVNWRQLLWRSTAIGLAAAGLFLVPLRAGLAQSDVLTRLAQFLTVTDKEIFIRGANLHLENGAGRTDSTNGLGNLIIGLNEERQAGNQRTGSHNLIVGEHNDFTGYGGIVTGEHNGSYGPWASVFGGTNNQAFGDSSGVLGSHDSATIGDYSAVVGGQANTTAASGKDAVICGGINNVTRAPHSWIGGGEQNEVQASANSGSISAGHLNIVRAAYSSVSGGVEQSGKWSGGLDQWRSGERRVGELVLGEWRARQHSHRWTFECERRNDQHGARRLLLRHGGTEQQCQCPLLEHRWRSGTHDNH